MKNPQPHLSDKYFDKLSEKEKKLINDFGIMGLLKHSLIKL